MVCHWVLNAWNNISEEIIIRAFEKCGISNCLSGKKESDEDKEKEFDENEEEESNEEPDEKPNEEDKESDEEYKTGDKNESGNKMDNYKWPEC
ncbi:4590_t:CDS:2 [Dentiscutata erythropus]|uniref:4590_t:CDS:1 n=1 Tax=Dentiscutata erythropus TaxID=1348616 RepID=A0A9N9HKR2_9GLOM|nr:4590_t:CDS:2 [Dentiscutata erythropus]